MDVASEGSNRSTNSLRSDTPRSVDRSKSRTPSEKSTRSEQTVFDLESAKTSKKDDGIEPRGEWSNQVEFILSCIGLAVGLGNIWRFPAMAYENGGSAFLFPYITCTLLFALPMVYAEFLLGQFTKSGPATVFRHYAPAFQGIGWCMVLISFTVSIYYTTIVAWAGVYVAEVIIGKSWTWTHCGNEWNNEYCNNETANTVCSTQNPSTPFAFNGSCIETSKELRYAAEQYFLSSVLQESTDIYDFTINWSLFASLVIMWAITALILCKGIKYMGKTAYVTSILPYILIIIMFINAIQLEGSDKGIEYYLGKPDWSKVLHMQTWSHALKQICFSMNIGYGGLLTLASYSRFSNNCLRDAAIVIGGDTFMSIFGGMTVFATLGFLSHELRKPIEEIVQSGVTLAFVAYPEALAKMPMPWLWALLFFIMLFCLGISSEIALVEIVCTGIYDSWPKTRKRKWITVVILCFIMFVLAAPQATKSGIYWFTIYNEFTGSTAPCIVTALEAILIAWVYRKHNMMKDVAMMRGTTTGCLRLFGTQSPYWSFNWMFISPILALVIMTFTLIRDDLWYVRGDGSTYFFPEWANILGWFLSLIPLIMIPLFFFKNWLKFVMEGRPFCDLFDVQPSNPSYMRIMNERAVKKGDSEIYCIEPIPTKQEWREKKKDEKKRAAAAKKKAKAEKTKIKSNKNKSGTAPKQSKSVKSQSKQRKAEPKSKPQKKPRAPVEQESSSSRAPADSNPSVPSPASHSSQGPSVRENDINTISTNTITQQANGKV